MLGDEGHQAEGSRPDAPTFGIAGLGIAKATVIFIAFIEERTVEVPRRDYDVKSNGAQRTTVLCK